MFSSLSSLHAAAGDATTQVVLGISNADGGGNGLWLADAHTGQTVEIEHPLCQQSAWAQIGTTSSIGYGEVPWGKLFSGYSA